jgi:hypothetical protein
VKEVTQRHHLEGLSVPVKVQGASTLPFRVHTAGLGGLAGSA